MFQMRGVIPPMLTPFQENGEVDYEGIKTLVGFCVTEWTGFLSRVLTEEEP